MARGYTIPGVSFTEREVISDSGNGSGTRVGVVGFASKGPTEVTKIGSVNQLVRIFGTPDRGISVEREGVEYNSLTDSQGYALRAATNILTNSGVVYFKRIIKGETAGFSTTDAVGGLVFSSKTKGSYLNGATIQVRESFTKSVTLEDATTHIVHYVTVSLYKGDELLERTGNYSINDEYGDFDIFETFNKRSEYLNLSKDTESLAEEDDEDEEITYDLVLDDGSDGRDSVTAEDVVTAMHDFYEEDKYPIDLLIVPGITESAVYKEADAIITNRQDILFIPDCPLGLNVYEAIAWANADNPFTDQLKMDSPFYSIYYPWVQEYDKVHDEVIYTPPSGWVASQMAYTDSNVGPWFSVAGCQSDFGRGVLTSAYGLERDLSKADRDILYDSNINPIINIMGKGIVIWGNKTAKRVSEYGTESLMCSINIRRVCNYIRKQIIEVSLSELFNPNDSQTWASWRLKLEPRLRAIQEGRGIDNYKIVMDSSTVTDDDIANGRMPGIVYIKPTQVVEWISISFIATRDTLTFEEEEEVS